MTSLLIVFDNGKFPSSYNQRDFLEVKKEAGFYLFFFFFFYALDVLSKGKFHPG